MVLGLVESQENDPCKYEKLHKNKILLKDLFTFKQGNLDAKYIVTSWWNPVKHLKWSFLRKQQTAFGR